MAKINELYKNYEDLSGLVKENSSLSPFEYKFTMFTTAAEKGTDQDKKFASMCISKFAKFFPELENTSITAMTSLFREGTTDVIQRQALRDISMMCQGMSREAVQKVTCEVCKFLLLDDINYVTASHSAIVCLYQIDPMATLHGLLKDLADGTPIRKERVLKILAMKSFYYGTIKPEARDYIIQECTNILKGVTTDEFLLVMAVLGQCRILESVSRQQLVDLLAKQCIFSQRFSPSDQQHYDRMLICIKYVLPYFSTGRVKSTAIVSYILEQVLPQRASIQNQNKLEIFKLMAELSTNCGSLDVFDIIGYLFNTLIEYISPRNVENGSASFQEVDLHHLEPLMYAFHQLCWHHPDFLKKFPGRMKHLRENLPFFNSKVQMITICESREGVSKDTALMAKSNLSTLNRYLIRNPPIFKAVELSFKSTAIPQVAKSVVVWDTLCPTSTSDPVPSGINGLNVESSTANIQAAKSVSVSNTNTEAPVQAAGKPPIAKAAPVKAAEPRDPPNIVDSPSKKSKFDRGEQPLYAVPVGKYSSNLASSTANLQNAKTRNVPNTNTNTNSTEAAPVKKPKDPITWDRSPPSSNSRPRGRGYRGGY